jgi:hypothetical protein
MTEMDHTHWEAKHVRFTRVISSGEITAHTYINPWAEIPPQQHGQTPKQQKGSGSDFGKFS